ncbi:TonB-dependent receptor domain-containing protein [Neokomagataea thailandica]|nr:TonB-dependent receptor [Neokomagataea thailandica]
MERVSFSVGVGTTLRPLMMSRSLLKVLLFAGISSASFVACEAQAQAAPAVVKASKTHHKVLHKAARVAPQQKQASTTTPVATIQPRAVPNVAPRGVATVAPVAAQSAVIAPAQSQEFVSVTGTRLAKNRLNNVMAGTTVDGAQLRARGYTDLSLAMLRENTAFSLGDASPIGGQNSFGAGQSFSSLLGLGSQRTLTLINGMRMVGGETASLYGGGSGSQVDVATIPTSLVKRVETKLGGAGAAYGADAVAGVINYELDDHFKGVDLTAQGNWSQKLDAPQEKITFKAGTSFDHDKGGVVFDLEYRGAGGMLANDRPYLTGSQATTYARPAYGVTTPYARVLTPQVRFLQNSVTGMPMLQAPGGSLPVSRGLASSYGVGNAAGQALMFSADGKSLVPLTTNSALRDGLRGSGGNGLALQNYSQLYAPSSKLNLTTLGHYDITDHLHATWQGWYAQGSASQLVGQGTWNTPQFADPLSLQSYQQDGVVNGAYQLSTNNPFLTSAERTTIKNALGKAGLPTDTFYLTRLNQDLDAGLYQTNLTMFRFQGGLNGDFNALGRNFGWSVKGEYSKYINDTVQPSIVTQNLTNALNATTDASGNIVCAPYTNSTAVTRSSTCAPLNPFGFNQLTPAARDYVISDAHTKNHNVQRDIQAEIHSTIVRLPAGDVAWDLGYEHRREGYDFNPGAFFAGEKQADGTYKQYGNATALPPTGGAYHTHEAFGELDVPLVSPNMHVPGIYNLSATTNGRFTNNSMTGNYWTYMFGGAWWPTRDFGFSGNYSQSVRNPSVTELFSPQSTSYESASDPCSIEYINSGPNPAIRAANCKSQGIPAGGFSSNINYYTIPGKSGGNPHLQNETSKSYTGTLDIHPHFMRGFDMTASFVDIKVNNEITSLSAGDLMNACYDSSSFPNSYCSSFSRDSNHQVTGFTDGYFNIANQHLQAMQAHLSYYLPLTRLGLSESFGDVELTGDYTHYIKNNTTYLGSTYQGVGTTSSPKDLATLNLNYYRGPFFMQWQTIYYGASQYAVQVASTTYEHNKRPDFAYFNTTFGYQITKNFDANFMINNITGALPKYPGTVSMTRYYDAIIGRSFQLNIGAHF